jgi:hypothetical protein
MDVWRILADGGEPQRMTHHNSIVGYPALIDNRTLIYSATAEDGSGFWLYAMDIEQKIPHRVTFGMDQYMSVSSDIGRDGHATRLVSSVANPIGELWTFPFPIRSCMKREWSVTRCLSRERLRLGSDRSTSCSYLRGAALRVYGKPRAARLSSFGEAARVV